MAPHGRRRVEWDIGEIPIGRLTTGADRRVSRFGKPAGEGQTGPMGIGNCVNVAVAVGPDVLPHDPPCGSGARLCGGGGDKGANRFTDRKAKVGGHGERSGKGRTGGRGRGWTGGRQDPSATP